MKSHILEKLAELEQTRKDFWNIPHESANFINMLIKTKNMKNILEIGTSNGYSAIWICDALSITKGHLVSLEFWQKRIDLAEENLKYCGLFDYITIKLGSALESIKKLSPKDFQEPETNKLALDMVFIDANKKEYIKYFELVHPLIKKNGIILADNVTSHKESTSTYVEAISQHPDYQTQLLPFDGGLLMSVKVV